MKFEEGKRNLLNYYTQVNTDTKIQNNKFVNLFFPLLKQHTTNYTNCKVCLLQWPQVCACSNKQTLDFVFILASRMPLQRFMSNELLFTYRFPQTSQQNQKTTSTKSRQDTFLKYRLGSNSSLAIRAKEKVIFQIFCSPEAKSSRNWRLSKRYLNPCMWYFPYMESGTFHHQQHQIRLNPSGMNESR